MSVNLNRHEMTKCRLRCAGTSLADISKFLGVSQSSVTVVSQGYRRSHRIQAEIAKRLGLRPEDLFPDRYSQEEEHITEQSSGN